LVLVADFHEAVARAEGLAVVRRGEESPPAVGGVGWIALSVTICEVFRAVGGSRTSNVVFRYQDALPVELDKALSHHGRFSV
jgi:hypothetical protein